jgi:predicted O-linked N-acetylglucosamine transferase (SPINDLY family)
MGIPVITLNGQVHAARVGVSLLTQTGLEDLIAEDPASYADMAVQLSENPERLANLHSSLRETMRHSSLCNGKQFTGELEQAYRNMWNTWCQSLDSGP